MTQIQLTDQQLNRTLAELMGYTIYHYDKDVPERCYYMLVYPDGEYDGEERDTEEEAWCEAPDYCNSPAASLEVQKRASQVNEERYLHTLVLITNDIHLEKYPHPFTSYGADLISPALTASPRERAEAAYITLSSEK